MTLALKEIFNINGWDAIEERSNVPDIKIIVDQKVKTFYTINVEDAMKKLSQVGQLLKLAVSGSKGFPCSQEVLTVLSNYQDLVKDSVITSSTFVEVVLKSLNFHKIALVLADKDKGDKALAILENCAELAGKMETESEKLVQKADQLSNLSVSALLSANGNYVGSEEKKKEMIERANKIKENLDKMKTRARDLEKATVEAEAESEKAAKEAQEKETVVLISGFLGPIGVSVSNEANKQAGEARERESKASELKRELQAEERNVNADLAESLTKLQNSVIEKNELDKAIISLEITINTLGKVKTVFLNAKQFWVSVKTHCASLTSNKGAAAYADPAVFKSCKEEFVEEIKKSGYDWLTLGKINRQAALAIRVVDKNIDGIMNDLPDKKKAEKLVNELTKTILGDIRKEQCMIEDVN